MDKYKELMRRKPKNFKRLIGVTEDTLYKMINVFKEYEYNRKMAQGVGGRKPPTPENKVLMMLSYYREYRTLEHIGYDFGVSESTALRIVREVEEVLLQSGDFSLPSKRALYEDGVDIRYIAIDATECPIERPKKNKESTIQERKSDIP